MSHDDDSRETLDYQQGADKGGSAQYDADAPRSGDGRSGMHTTWALDDVPEAKRDLFERLWSHHEGHRHLSREARREANRERDVRTLAAVVELTDAQAARACELLQTFDFEAHGNPDTETIVLAAVARAAADDDRWLAAPDSLHGEDAVDPLAPAFAAAADDWDADLSEVQHYVTEI